VSRYKLSARAIRDLGSIWDFVSIDDVDAADRVIDKVKQQFEQLATMPRLGHKRTDLTSRRVLFWPVYSYLIVYRPASPLQVVRVLHAKRHVRQIL